jgi:hypothetical protein
MAYHVLSVLTMPVWDLQSVSACLLCCVLCLLMIPIPALH